MLSWISAFDGHKGKVDGRAIAKLSPETSIATAKFQNYCKVNAAIACAGFFSIKTFARTIAPLRRWTDCRGMAKVAKITEMPPADNYSQIL
jgi:hypothetical protein